MFSKSTGKYKGRKYSLELNEGIRVALEFNSPPLSPHLFLIKENKNEIDISVSLIQSRVLKETIQRPECTDMIFLSTLHQLALNKFAEEVEKELKK
jgi:hypothetical protein